ncbi:MAG TPA: prolyl oligopeptidase family serine peptidase [bacterium]|nr:prolyl oligopeptidase family serine peptidase [bacterium]
MKRVFIVVSVIVSIAAGCKKEAEKPAVPAVSAVAAAEKAPEVYRPVKDLTIADYINIEGSHSGYIMKDGKKLYIARKDNAAQLYLVYPDGKITLQITDMPDPVEGYVVSPEETRLIFISAKGGNEQYNFYLYEFATQKTEPLLVDDKVRMENPEWLNENEILFTSNEVNGKDFYIYHFDIAAKKKTLIVEKPGYNILTDAKSKDEFIYYTMTGNNITVPYEYKNGRSVKIKGAKKDRKYVPVAYFQDGILMKTNENEEMEYLEIWKEVGRQPFFKDKWEVDSVVVDKKNRNSAAFCTNEDGLSRCRYYLDGKTGDIPLENSVVGLTRMSDGKVIYNMMDSDKIMTPFVFDTKEGKALFFGYRFDNGIDVSKFVKPVLKKVKSFDGVEIPYFLYTPKDAKPPYKTIVSFHGGPEGQFRPYFAAIFQYYISKGFAIVAPNVRGSTGYGQKFMDMDNYKLRMNSVRDGKAITDQLVKDGISAPGKFIATGGSYGGFMVVASMAKFPEDYMCGIDTVGVVDFVNFLENTKSYRRKLREVEYGPLTDKAFLKSISPVNMVDTIRGELFVAHGMNDPRVPVSDANILLEKLEKAGKKTRKLIFEDEGHGFRKRENRLTYNIQSAEFIEGCK